MASQVLIRREAMIRIGAIDNGATSGLAAGLIKVRIQAALNRCAQCPANQPSLVLPAVMKSAKAFCLAALATSCASFEEGSGRARIPAAFRQLRSLRHGG